MAEIWFASDHHIDHANILNFKLDDGVTPMRDFPDVKTMTEVMVTRHNEVVKPEDKVYFLGDFAIKKRNVNLAALFNGHKRLLRGNHDDASTKEYLKYFEEVYASRLLDNCLFTHIPVHPDSIKMEWTNVHGHLHNNGIPMSLGTKYLNICVELTDYRPLTLGQVKERIAAQKRRNMELIVGHLAHMGVTNIDLDELPQ